MKIVLTGHTSGLGAALFNEFKNLDYYNTVYGASRSADCDISTIEGKQKIIDECQNADLFINNAFVPEGHTTNLLHRVLQDWYGNKNKMVIHIGSDIVNYREEFIPETMRDYRTEKLEQHMMVKNAQQDPQSVPIVNVLLGAMDTTAAVDYEGNKMNTNRVAMMITEAHLYWPSIHVQEMHLMPGV